MNVCFIHLFTLVYWCMWWHSHVFSFIIHIVSYVDIGGQHWWSRYSLWQPAIVHSSVSYYCSIILANKFSLCNTVCSAVTSQAVWGRLCRRLQEVVSFELHIFYVVAYIMSLILVCCLQGLFVFHWPVWFSGRRFLRCQHAAQDTVNDVLPVFRLHSAGDRFRRPQLQQHQRPDRSV